MRRFNAAAVTVALLAATAACGGSDKQTAAPPTSKPTSTTPTTPAGPTPPVRPAAVMKRGDAGVTAAVEYWIDGLNYASLTGDTKPFRSSFTRSCTKCDVLADGVDDVYRNGGKIEGDGWTPKKIVVVEIAGRLASVEAFVNQAPQIWLERAGDEPTNYPGGTGRSKILITRWDNQVGWRVNAYDPDVDAP